MGRLLPVASTLTPLTPEQVLDLSLTYYRMYEPHTNQGLVGDILLSMSHQVLQLRKQMDALKITAPDGVEAMPQNSRLYFSERGFPLIYWGPPPEGSGVLTVENYMKWYAIYAVMPDGTSRKVDHSEYADAERGKDGSHTWSDHIPNPHMLDKIAAHLKMDWDEDSYDMIVGRYQREVMNWPN